MPPALSSAMTMKRIHREIADVQREDLGAITLAPTRESLYRWKATIPGPQGSPYEGGVFNVDIQLSPDYPFSAPKVTFSTRIYHMNISDKGGICIDILKQNWSPALSLYKVMLSLSSLLTDPNPQDPLGELIKPVRFFDKGYILFGAVPSIATEYVRNRQQHDRTARRWTELYARPPPPPPVSLPSVSSSGTTTSSRSKGKEKAPVQALQVPVPTSAREFGGTAAVARLPSRPGTLATETPDITVVSTSSSTSVAGKKRQREVDTIDLVEEEERAQRTKSRNRPGTSSSGLSMPQDVIVIDD